jgi:magnesium-transporting ATPase (P-type)
MNTYWFSILFIAWYAAALLVSEKIGKRRSIGVEWSFFLGILFSPVVALVACYLSKPSERGSAEIENNGD